MCVCVFYYLSIQIYTIITSIRYPIKHIHEAFVHFFSILNRCRCIKAYQQLSQHVIVSGLEMICIQYIHILLNDNQMNALSFNDFLRGTFHIIQKCSLSITIIILVSSISMRIKEEKASLEEKMNAAIHGALRKCCSFVLMCQ